MDSNRHEKKAAKANPECRTRLVHGPSQNRSVKRMALILVASKGLGCAASVLPVEEAISARPVRYKANTRHTENKKRDKGIRRARIQPNEPQASPPVVRVCCGPGILFSPDADCVDSVQSRRRRRRASAEMIMHYSPLFEESRADDQLQEWRLDIDDMSYEELLDLSDRIGYESTGLKKNDLLRCLSKARSRKEEMLSLLLNVDEEWNCSICQNGLESRNQVGRLDCGHSYHINCLERWLQCKNSCPICKHAALARR